MAESQTSEWIKKPLIDRSYGNGRNRVRAPEGGNGIEKLDKWVAAMAATTEPLPAYTAAGDALQGNVAGKLMIDGVDCVEGTRVLVKNETDKKLNGLWFVSVEGDEATKWELTRVPDANAGPDFAPGKTVRVIRGFKNKGRSYALAVSGAVTVGTTELEFSNIGFDEE